MEQSNKISDFLKTLCDQIRWKKAHNLILKEMKDHIIDQKNAFIKEGLDEETAIDKAIKEMGDPVSIGSELDYTHRPKTEWSIILLTGIIILFGFGIRFLASFEPNVPYLLEKSLFATIIGMACMWAAYFIDFTIIGRYPKSIFIGLISLTILAIILFSTIYGRPAHVQFILLLFPTAMAGIIYNMRDRGYLGIVLSEICLIIFVLIGIKTSSLFTVILCTLSFLILITIAIKKDWFNVNKIKGLLLVYLPIIAVSSIIIIYLISNNNYYINRVLVAFNPSMDPMGAGYLGVKIRDILSNAKLIGSGTMTINSHMVPNISTDYILTYIIHRLGWIPFIVVIAAMSLLIIQGFKLCFKQKSILGRLVSMAVLTTFTVEVVFYTVNNLGLQLFPSTTLPFISYSGMSTIINMLLIGVMLSVFRSGDIVRDSIIKSSKNKLFEMIDGKIIIDLNSK